MKCTIGNYTLFKDRYDFAAKLLRYCFAILFIFIAIKKFRMGYMAFAESLVHPEIETTLSADIPAFLLYTYGIILPAVELLAGTLLLLDIKTLQAYAVIGLFYLTFIFGQVYNGNAGIVGSEYLPSVVALVLAYGAYEISKEKK